MAEDLRGNARGNNDTRKAEILEALDQLSAGDLSDFDLTNLRCQGCSIRIQNRLTFASKTTISADAEPLNPPVA